MPSLAILSAMIFPNPLEAPVTKPTEPLKDIKLLIPNYDFDGLGK